jgi:ABC-type protease/lipase transport system fused ATPase/permease subunit
MGITFGKVNTAQPARATQTPDASQVIPRAEHLSPAVGDRQIDADISLDVLAEDVIAIVGPSRAGKSPLLRLLNQLDEPTAGTIMLGGQDYRQMPSRQLRRRVGMVLQAAYLLPDLQESNCRQRRTGGSGHLARPARRLAGAPTRHSRRDRERRRAGPWHRPDGRGGPRARRVAPMARSGPVASC